MHLEYLPTPPPAPADLDATVTFLTREERDRLPAAVPEAEFPGGPRATVFFHAERRLFVGLGTEKKLDGDAVRCAAGVAARWLQKRGRVGRVAVELTGPAARFVPELTEGLILGSYRFDTFQRPEPDGDADPGEGHPRPPRALEHVVFGGLDADRREAVRAAGQRGQARAEATNYARQLANQPPNLFTPESVAEAARQLAVDSAGKLEVEVFDEDRLRAEGFGGLLAVGGGSVHPPRLVILRHAGEPGPRGAAPLVFLGKAITFDSGGLSLKRSEGMEEMIWDKCGGCAVLGAMHGLLRLPPARPVVGVIASAENLTGPGAYRPGDVITAYDGKKIEINNTDAEGRIVLADALGYARRHLNPAAMVDLATLTGGCVVALGEETAGLWSNDDDWRERVGAAARRAGEAVWPMPITREHEEKIKSDVALIKNSAGRYGSPCTAAAFLRRFAGKVPWAHLDIAGTNALTKERPDLARGATGYGVRTLLELAAAPVDGGR